MLSLNFSLPSSPIQLSCLRAEQGQLSKSLEKERQRAAENRQEYLAAKEEADTLEGRANQLEVEIRELRRKHKQELQEVLLHNELIQKVLHSFTDISLSNKSQSDDKCPISYRIGLKYLACVKSIKVVVSQTCSSRVASTSMQSVPAYDSSLLSKLCHKMAEFFSGPREGEGFTFGS